MKAGYPPIDIKFTDRRAYYEAFGMYYIKTTHLQWKNYLQNVLMNSWIDISLCFKNKKKLLQAKAHVNYPERVR